MNLFRILLSEIRAKNVEITNNTMNGCVYGTRTANGNSNALFEKFFIFINLNIVNKNNGIIAKNKACGTLKKL
jgi:hypothetical protein